MVKRENDGATWGLPSSPALPALGSRVNGTNRVDRKPGEAPLRAVVAGRTVFAWLDTALTEVNAREITERLLAFCVAGSECVLDLRRCEKVDRAGVSVLLAIQDELRHGGGGLRLVADLDGGIGRMLRHLDGDRRLEIQSERSFSASLPPT